MPLDYDQLAEEYRIYRKPDPRIAERIHFHLRDARSILNVGAGTGAYEPEGTYVVAVEPSFEMIMNREKICSAPVRGIAEELPFKDSSFDCSTGILTLHHWRDIPSGLREMLRVTKQRIVLFTWIGYCGNFWLENYIPEITGVDEKLFPTLEELEKILGNISVETLEIPSDCSVYLDPGARKAISTFSRISGIYGRLEKLRRDIENGEWQKKYSHLLERESLDLGYRLVVWGKQIPG